MTSATTNQPPFRFLDLPTELRLCVYEYVPFPTTRHALDRTDAKFQKLLWPVPSTTQVHGSRLTLIRPSLPLALLLTCRLVHDEALLVFKRRMQDYTSQPVRYLADWSAAWALVNPWSLMSGCVGITTTISAGLANKAVLKFVRRCEGAIAATRQTRGSRGVQAIELTITHQDDVVYGSAVPNTTLAFSDLNGFLFGYETRFTVVRKARQPTTTVDKYSRVFPVGWDHGVGPKEGGGTLDSFEPGVFVRKLDEKRFAKHVEGLEWY